MKTLISIALIILTLPVFSQTFKSKDDLPIGTQQSLVKGWIQYKTGKHTWKMFPGANAKYPRPVFIEPKSVVKYLAYPEQGGDIIEVKYNKHKYPNLFNAGEPVFVRSGLIVSDSINAKRYIILKFIK